MAHILDLDKIEGLRRNGLDFIGRCPVCALENRDRQKNHLSILSSGIYNCIADKEHNRGIYQLIGVGSDGIIEDRPIEQPKIECNKVWPIELLDKLIPEYSYFEGRGISAGTQRKFRMGVATMGQMARRIVIPILSEDKRQVIGFTGRTLIKDVKPKWRHLGSKTNWILCGDEKNIPHNSILITEGPADILALYEAGIKNTLCLFGTTISSKQLAFLIKNNPSRIVIGLNNEPDNNSIGNLAAEKLRKVLLNYFNEEKVVIGLPEVEGCKDFNDLLEKDKKLLDDYRKKWLI